MQTTATYKISNRTRISHLILSVIDLPIQVLLFMTPLFCYRDTKHHGCTSSLDFVDFN